MQWSEPTMKSRASVWWRTAIALFAFFLTHTLALNAQEIEDCLVCHEDRTFSKTDAAGKVHSLFVDRDGFKRSVHGKAGYTCVDCHEGVAAAQHPAGGIPDVSCGKCHSEIEQEQLKSKHGQLLHAGNPSAPRCQDCHSAHQVLLSSDPQSSVHPENLAYTCGVCHEEEAKPGLASLALNFVKGKSGAEQFSLTALLAPLVTRIKGHGKVNMACEYSTRRCGDCHHDVVRHGDSEKAPKVCSTCHEVDKSSIVFGKIHRSGVLQSPILSSLLVLAYLVVIAGIIFYFKQPATKKNQTETSGE